MNRQTIDPFLSTLYVMDEQTIPHFLAGTGTDGLNTGNEAMGSMNTLIEIIPKGFSSTLHQLDQLETTLAPLPGYLAYLNGEEVASSVLPASETEVIPPELANYVLNPNWTAENHQKELRDESQSPQLHQAQEWRGEREQTGGTWKMENVLSKEMLMTMPDHMLYVNSSDSLIYYQLNSVPRVKVYMDAVGKDRLFAHSSDNKRLQAAPTSPKFTSKTENSMILHLGHNSRDSLIGLPCQNQTGS
ncbi:hypothetical protein Q3G72_018368 [Acer saccharum]|nr:hypothetical protein Q3G72_018368 [Acer saccharum]